MLAPRACCARMYSMYVCMKPCSTVYKYLLCAALNDGGMARCCPQGRRAQKEPALARLDAACVCARALTESTLQASGDLALGPANGF